MDPLSEVLSLLNNQTLFFGGLKTGGDWAIRFPAPDSMKFNAVVKGFCWLAVEGMEHPVRLEEGDCFLVSRGRPVVVGSDLSLPVTDAEDIYRDAVDGMAHHGDSDDCFLIGGRFSFGDEADILLDSLPMIVVVKRDSEQAAVLQWALRQLAHELSTSVPGSASVAQHLGHIMLVQVLRIYLAQERGNTPSWLAALSEPRIGAVIQAVHANPAKRWTVEDLAEVACISRSTLALRFKQVAGVPPLEYVSRWRMHLAARSLRKSQLPISSIAQTLGYESDSAFSSAFKRIMKCSPKDYRAKHMNRKIDAGRYEFAD
jgi:AraC-like DNA-binding protein